MVDLEPAGMIMTIDPMTSGPERPETVFDMGCLDFFEGTGIILQMVCTDGLLYPAVVIPRPEGDEVECRNRSC